MSRAEASSSLRAAFGRLEGRLRRLLAWYGVAQIIVLAVAAAIVSYLVDRSVELPLLVRLLVLVGTGALLVRVIIRGRRRVRVAVADEELLRTVEASDPRLDGQLLNAIELGRQWRRERRRGGERSLRSELLRRAARESRLALVATEPSAALDGAPLRRLGGLALVAGLMAVVWVLLAPGEFGRWAGRNLLLRSTAWPRHTHFAREGPPSPWHVRRGDPVAIEGWLVGRVPRDVFVEIESGGEARRSRLVPGVTRRGSWRVRSLVAAGAPSPGRAVGGRRLSTRLEAVTDDLRFRFLGGDNRSTWTEIMVHDPPRLLAARIVTRPPPHTGRSDGSIEEPPDELGVPQGTILELEGETDLALREAWYRFGEGGRQAVTDLDGRRFRVRHVVEASGLLEIEFRGSAHGFAGRPWRTTVVANPDRPPLVRLSVDGASRRVTPSARRSLRVRVTDDHGLTRIELRVEERAGAESSAGEAERIDLAPWVPRPVDGAVLVDESRTLDVGRFEFAVGTRFSVTAVAIDNDAPGGFKEGRSASELFDVVSPDVLRDEMAIVRRRLGRDLEDLARGERDLADALERLAGNVGVGGSPSEGSPAGRTSRMRSLAARQRAAAERAAGIGRELDEWSRALRDNELAQDAETRRFEDEIAGPLRELAGGELPRSADALEEMAADPDADEIERGAERVRRLGEEVEELARALESTVDYRELLERLEGIVELHGRVIESTEAEAGRRE